MTEAERTAALQRAARRAGLSPRQTISIEDVDHRRSQLWAIAFFVMASLSAVLALTAGTEDLPTSELASMPAVRIGIVALIFGLGAYLFEKERHLRSLTHTLLQERQLIASLAHEASHDPLTGLLNRSAFLDVLEESLARSRRVGRSVAVLFLDLDGFKEINDELGHEAGDEILREVGARLRDCVRSADSVARLGGDEFTVVLDGTREHDEAISVADRIDARLQEPTRVDGREVSVRASIGITVSVDGDDRPEELLREADIAMYLAKRASGSRFEVFDTERMSVWVDAAARRDVELRKPIGSSQDG